MAKSTLIISKKEVNKGRDFLVELDKGQQEKWERKGFDYSQISRGSFVIDDIEFFGREKCFDSDNRTNELRKFLINFLREFPKILVSWEIRKSISSKEKWRDEGRDLIIKNWEYLPKMVRAHIRRFGEIEWMNRRRKLLENYENLEKDKKIILRNGFVIALEISKLIKDSSVNYTKLTEVLEGMLSKREISVAIDSFLLDFMFIKYYSGISNPGEKKEMASTGLIKFTN